MKIQQNVYLHKASQQGQRQQGHRHHNKLNDIYSHHRPATTKVAAVGRHHRRGAVALRPRHLFWGFLVMAMSRVDVVELVVDLVDVGLVDVDLDVDHVDVDLDVVPFCGCCLAGSLDLE